MRALVLCVGRLKEKYWREACAEYLKRLTRYAQVELIEVTDAPDPAHDSPAEQAKVLRVEGERLLSRIRPDDYVIALAIAGDTYDSVSFSRHLEKLESKGRLVFVIGGSLGLAPEVYARAEERISFSDLTFPHQLMRVIFLEQLYRAQRIRSREPYHK